MVTKITKISQKLKSRPRLQIEDYELSYIFFESVLFTFSYDIGSRLYEIGTCGIEMHNDAKKTPLSLTTYFFNLQELLVLVTNKRI